MRTDSFAHSPIDSERTDDSRQLRLFLVTTFVISWTAWIPAGADARGTIDLPLPTLALVVIGALGPMIGALVTTAHFGGRRATRELLERLRPRTVTRRWLLVAFGVGAVTITPGLAYLLSGRTADGTDVGPHLAVLPIHFILVATIGGGLDEELGWRGMAQPLLQRRLPALTANVVVGLIWAVWHLPLWLDPNSAQAAYPFALYTAIILGHSITTGWLYNATGGSILIAVVVHSTHNTFDGLRYAILGDAADHLGWQVSLAVASLGLGIAITLATRGRLGSDDRHRPVRRSLPTPRRRHRDLLRVP